MSTETPMACVIYYFNDGKAENYILNKYTDVRTFAAESHTFLQDVLSAKCTESDCSKEELFTAKFKHLIFELLVKCVSPFLCINKHSGLTYMYVIHLFGPMTSYK